MEDIQAKIKELEENGTGIFNFADELLTDSTFYQKYFLYPDKAMKLKDIGLIKEVLYRVRQNQERVFITDTLSELRSRQNGALRE